MCVVFVGFALFSFELFFYIKERTRFIFLLAWVLCTVYSVFTISQGLYTIYSEKAQEATVSQANRSNQQEKVALYKGEISKYNESEGDVRVKLKVQQNLLEGVYSTLEGQLEDKKGYNDTMYRIRLYEGQLASISAERAIYKNKLEGILEGGGIVAKEKEDAFSWFTSIFGGRIQFILQSFPALILDAISAIGLYVFLFLGKKKKSA
jgi:hypothetical protein